MLWLPVLGAVLLAALIIVACADKCACGCASAEACRCDGAHCVRCAGCGTCKTRPHPTCNCDFCKKRRG
jgi:hypothetical protein